MLPLGWPHSDGSTNSNSNVTTFIGSSRVSVHLWRWSSYEGAGMLHCTDGHRNRTSKETKIPSVRLLYRNGVIQFQQVHSRIHSSSVVKNDYGCKLMPNSFPGHQPNLPKICGARCRKLRTKPGPSIFRNIFIVSRHMCKTFGIKTLFLSTMFDP